MSDEVIELRLPMIEDKMNSFYIESLENITLSGKAADQPKLNDLSHVLMQDKMTEAKRLPVFQSRSWVPCNAQEAGIVTDALNVMGTIFVNRDEVYSSRDGQSRIICDGMGKFFTGTGNYNCLVVSLPMARLVELGVCSWTVMKFVDSLDQKDFTFFMDTNVKHCQLTSHNAVWVPYGHCAIIISLPSYQSEGSEGLEARQMPNIYLHVPQCCLHSPSGSGTNPRPVADVERFQDLHAKVRQLLFKASNGQDHSGSREMAQGQCPAGGSAEVHTFKVFESECFGGF